MSNSVISKFCAVGFVVFALAACVKPDGRNKCSSGPGLSETPVFGKLPPKTLALTFDDGPGLHTASLLDTLDELAVPGTFFVVGQNALTFPDLMTAMRRRGHLVANHTNSHPDLTKTGNSVAELRRADAAIAPYIPGNIFLFRAPYGQFTPNVIQSANAGGLGKYWGPIHWDIGEELTDNSGADWACVSKNLTAEQCGALYLKEIQTKGGGVVLLHDTVTYISDLVRSIVVPLKADGWQFVRIDQAENIAAQIKLRGGSPGAAGGTDYCYDF